jgi:hypothetical protein
MNQESEDPRLQSALRHAPDHDIEPPPALNASILRAAHQSVATPAWRRWLEWLASPGWATSTAGVMVALLTGLLWWGQEPPAPVVAMAPQQPAPAPAAAAAPPADVPAQAPGGAAADAMAPAETAARAPAPSPAKAVSSAWSANGLRTTASRTRRAKRPPRQ